MPSLQQRFGAEIEPKDPAFKSASPALRRKLFDAAGRAVLDELSKQLGKGIGRNGRAMKVRIQPVLADGADGPVMEPHYLLSRVITLADYTATDRGLTLWWHAGTGHATHRRARKKGRKATPFGTILGFHADGLVPHAPARDVRLCKARVANVQRAMDREWGTMKPPPPKPAPKPAPRPRPAAPRRPPAPIPKGRGPHAVESRSFRTVLPPKGTPAPRPGTEAQAGGLNFGRDPASIVRNYRLVTLDAAKLRAALARDAGFDVGPGGAGPSARPGAYEQAAAFLEAAAATGAVVHAPRVALDAQGEPFVDDGRHRLAALSDRGLKSLVVAVPAKSVRSLLARFGP